MQEDKRLIGAFASELSETNPENNFGVNSYQMIQPKKIQRKLQKILEFVKIDELDEKLILEQKISNLGRSVFFGFLGMSFVVLSKHLLRNSFFHHSYQNYFLSKIFVFSTISYFSYLPASYSMALGLYQDLIQKYQQQAICNGFQDYDISPD